MRAGRLAVRGSGAPPQGGRVVAAAVCALVCVALPVFLVGALSPRISDDLGLDPAAIGVLVGAFFLASAVSALPIGAVVERIGASTALRAGALTATVAAAAVGGLAGGMAWLLALLVLAGCAVPLVDTGSARAIRAAVAYERQGAAFGAKEASVPAAALVAGVAVPAVGAQVGWRPAFLGAAVLAALVAALLVPRRIDVGRPGTASATPRRAADSAGPTMAPIVQGVDADDGVSPDMPAHRRADGQDVAARRRRALLLLAVATATGGAAATAAPAFLVPAVMSLGTSETAAGILLAASSAAGIATRLVAGLVVDRRRADELHLTAVLMAVGAFGLLALATGQQWATMPGALLALGAGWGWTGLAYLGAVHLAPTRPAAAAGRILACLMVGGTGGAAAFGWLVAGPGYQRAWQTAVAAMAVAALLSGVAARSR